MKLLEINKSIKLLKFIQIKKTYKHFDTSHLVCVRRAYLCTPLSTLFNSWAPIRLLPYFPRECRVYAGLADSGRFKRRFFLPATGHHHHSRLFLLRESRALKGILHQKIFYCLNLIFWIIMGCGIARFGRKGLKTTET